MNILGWIVVFTTLVMIAAPVVAFARPGRRLTDKDTNIVLLAVLVHIPAALTLGALAIDR